MSSPTVSDTKSLPSSESNIVKEEERVQYEMQPFLGDAASEVDDVAHVRDSLKTTKDSTGESVEKSISLSHRPESSLHDALLNEETKSKPQIDASSIDSPIESQKKAKSGNLIHGDTTKLEESIANIDRIVNPEPTDVLFGRGKPYQGHSGNQKLREIVDKYKDAYMSSRRYDKLAIAEDIVKGIQGGRWGEAGRFLRRADNGEDFWVVAPDDEAREKVSHALRGKKKTNIAAPHGQNIGDKKERKIDAGSSVEDYLNSAGKQQLHGLRTSQDPGENNLAGTEIRLPDLGTNLGITADRQRMLMLAGNLENQLRPGGAVGTSIVPPLDLQSLLRMSTQPANRQQQLLQQQTLGRDAMTSSLFGREERNVVQDLSLIANSNRFLASQLGLINNDPRLAMTPSSLPHPHLNPQADIFGRAQPAVNDGRITSDVSPLISALLGQRVGSDGTRGQQPQMMIPGSTLNISDVMRELQQARDQRALAELILRSRGNSGSFGAETNHQS